MGSSSMESSLELLVEKPKVISSDSLGSGKSTTGDTLPDSGRLGDLFEIFNGIGFGLRAGDGAGSAGSS